MSNRLQDLSLPDVTRIDSDFECAKVSLGEIFLSLHERAERETKILKCWQRAKTGVYSMLGLVDQIEIDHFDEISLLFN